MGMKKTMQFMAQKRAGLLAAMVIAIAAAPAAFAGTCSSKEEETTGANAAKLVRDQVSTVVSVEGKEMIHLTDCAKQGANFAIEYKYNFMGPDGYYWVEGKGSLDGAGAGSVTFTKLSDKLKEAAAAKNVQLASR